MKNKLFLSIYLGFSVFYLLITAFNQEEIARVLSTYSQKHLISGNNILITLLENIPDINNKKLYFSREGQIAWLVSYIADNSKRVKKIM